MSHKLLIAVLIAFSANSFAEKFGSSEKGKPAPTKPVEVKIVDNVPGGVNLFFTYNDQCKATLNSSVTITKAKTKLGKAVRLLKEDIAQVDQNIHQITDSNDDDLQGRFQLMDVIGQFDQDIVFNLEVIEKEKPALARKIEKACGLENRTELNEGYAPSPELFELFIGG